MPPSHTPVQYTTRIHDYPLHYTEAGSGEILLLIHGSLCDYRYWRWQIPALSQHYRVVAPSLRGFWPAALRSADDSFSIAQHIRDMSAFARRLGEGRPVHVLGHSRGAQIALELACGAPQEVRSLILADPGFRIAGEAPGAPLHTTVAKLLERGEVEPALAEFVDAVNGAGTWRQMVSWFKTMVTDNAYTLLSQIREINLDVDLDRARRLQCPVLLVGGAHSPARYGSRLDRLEQAVGQARRITIPAASHGMNLANPKAFNQGVLNFLAGLRADEARPPAGIP
ncbi:alpha/beta fold hydrolase [Pollutimonas bauzanensis]|uniref:Pimeloyl-ACP methyl ester carboxylesterase n=1 Tax=Pollutimonas bauzanensis TaxID=658167 RepID=A0A1M5ZI06_9BURK|nr:alpha/beta hydrolase [Pollutimonas bauzanensis]SHI23937.1 Pimeloyl-ACP methyl ester carboxylesterase [Pollutimonas bauzanensis]